MRFCLLIMVSGYEGLEVLHPIYKLIMTVRIKEQSNYALFMTG